jgi:hypothetical protein
MADIGHELMVKYGLSRRATPTECTQWVQRVEALIRQGIGREEAGRHAASELLPGYNTHVYRTQADTIEALLSRANER